MLSDVATSTPSAPLCATKAPFDHAAAQTEASRDGGTTDLENWSLEEYWLKIDTL